MRTSRIYLPALALILLCGGESFINGNGAGKIFARSERNYRPYIPRPDEILPHIPGPRKRKKEPVKKEPVKKEPVKKEPVKKEPVKKEPVKKGPEQFEGVREFPHEKFKAFLGELEKTPVDRLSEKLRRQFERRLQKILERGVYRFGAGCGLEYTPALAADDRLTVLLACLSPLQQNAFSITTFLTKKSPNYWTLSLKKKRRLRGEIELKNLKITSRGLEWNWREVEYRYQNPFLQVLRKKYPELSEAELLSEKPVSERIGEIFQKVIELEEGGQNKDWKTDLQAVLRKGMGINFGDSCPLKVIRPPRVETGIRRVRVLLELSCLAGHSLGGVNLLLPPEVLQPAPEVWSGPGARLYASLEFNRFFTRAGQLYIAWDTINNISLSTR